MWKLDCEEGWAPKNWCLWTVVLEKTLESPWTARSSNQSILKEISPGISLEGMMLKLKLQYFGHLMRRVNSLEKTLMLGGIAGRRRRGRQRMSWLDGITNSMDVEFGWTPGVGDEQGGLACYSSWGYKDSHTTEKLNWTELTSWTFVDKVMSLLFNILSGLVITCLPRSKHLLISWLQSPSVMILEPRNISHCFHCFPIYLP